ncbi:MAG: phosphoglucosamine mutase [Acidobacteria bacterium]|nr:phosphoglucosamine mutase [Acidobacteriota bacterium]
MSLKHFGTDGIRGRAYEPPLRLEDAARWGAAWSQVARRSGVERLVAGWDPRLSSEPLLAAFRQGVGMRLEVLELGMVPTPAVAWTTAELSATGPRTWGLVISASHNPPEDNGLKGFNEAGEKLEEEQERDIEEAFESLMEPTTILTEALRAPMDPYLWHLEGVELGADFPVVVDCAHGATAPWAPRLIRGQVSFLGVPADGSRINLGVGSTHLGALQAEVRARKAALGVAFDGDGDRCLLVDPEGHPVDGDQMLWLLVQDRLARGLGVPGVVGTLMTNAGLESALVSAGVPFVRTPVGDKFMLRELNRRGWDLAAEASGHLIQRHLGPSGDGLATALELISALRRRPPAERWSWRFPPWPLRLVNLACRDRVPLESCRALEAERSRLERTHGPELRIVLRWSGTEAKLRLMVEARERAVVDMALLALERAAREDLARLGG